jgi:hypothetical protein
MSKTVSTIRDIVAGRGGGDGAGARRLRPAGEQAARRTAHAYPAENREPAESVDGVCLGAALPLGPGVVAPLRFIPAFTDFLTRLTQVQSCFLRIALDLFRCPVRIFPDLPCSRPLPVSVAAARCKYQPDPKHKK